MLGQAPIQLHPAFRVDVEIYLTQAKLETTSPKNFQPNLLLLMAEILLQ